MATVTPPALRVSPGQERFVDGVADSLREAAAHPEARPWFRAVYADDVPVGFLMLADGAEPGNGVIPWPHYLWRMLIDSRHQGQGYGRTALDLVVAHLRERSDADVAYSNRSPPVQIIDLTTRSAEVAPASPSGHAARRKR